MADYEEEIRRRNSKAAPELVESKGKHKVQCLGCGHKCVIRNEDSGICRMRWNDSGELRVPYGYVSSIHADPMEKKPFFHALPGQRALSFGMLGCNLQCPYCQNWNISQNLKDSKARVQPRDIEPEELIERARRANVNSVVATYNEPLITSEWSKAVFELAKQENYVTGYVSNGYASREVIEYLRPLTDLFNVDFKAWTPEKYEELGGKVEVVKEMLELIFELDFHLEVITLIVPDRTDDPEELRRMADFLASISPDIPWHLSAFRGAYKWKDHPSTSPAVLKEAYDIAREAGMNYVYCGNLPGRVGEAESTYCPECEELLIKRTGYSIGDINLENSNCPECGHEVYGVFSGT